MNKTAVMVFVDAFNCCPDLLVSVTHDKVMAQTGRNHENIVDTRTLSNVLDALKAHGIVDDSVQTMWAGIRDSMFIVWCSRR